MCSTGYVRGSANAPDQCTQCPAGSWCPEQSTVRPCTDNALSLPGSYNAGNCTLCADGWLKNGPLSCRRCNSGYACPTSSTEELCLEATYAPALAPACVTCAAGSYSAKNASTACTPCASNSDSVAGATAETQCVCSDGYYKLGLSKTCGSCPAGSACSNNLINQCPVGKTSASGQTVCTDCEQGTYQPTVGGSVCISCPAGATVVLISPQTELNAPVDHVDAMVKATTGKLYIMRLFFEVSAGKKLVK